MSEPSQKCDNNNQKLLISFKISYSCCFGFRGNLEFPAFLKKKFYKINYWTSFLGMRFYRYDLGNLPALGLHKIA